MKISGLVPARFLTIIAHLVIVIVIFWSRDSNVRQCLPVTYSTSEYDQRDLEFIIALSVTLGLTAIELLGFLSGISMFMPFQSLLSIGAHFGACIGLAYFIFWKWPCYFYWYFFGLCSATPAVTEIITIIGKLCLRRGL